MLAKTDIKGGIVDHLGRERSLGRRRRCWRGRDGGGGRSRRRSVSRSGRRQFDFQGWGEVEGSWKEVHPHRQTSSWHRSSILLWADSESSNSSEVEHLICGIRNLILLGNFCHKQNNMMIPLVKRFYILNRTRMKTLMTILPNPILPQIQPTQLKLKLI